MAGQAGGAVDERRARAQGAGPLGPAVRNGPACGGGGPPAGAAAAQPAAAPVAACPESQGPVTARVLHACRRALSGSARASLARPLVVATAATAVLAALAWLLDRSGLHAAARAAYVLAYASGGWHATRAGLQALRQGRVDVDLLMVLAALGAAALGYWHEGAVLLFLFALSNALQELALDRARRAVQALMNLHPEQALRRSDRGEEWVPVEALRPGDVVIVRPGDRVPVDGLVLRGSTAVDQSPITGESRPVPKAPGDAVFAGSINQAGAVEVRVTRPAAESTLARIARLVEQAQQAKARAQERIERFEQAYAKAVIGAAALAALVPVALGEAPGPAVYRALTLMVVASPCAVAIAAPAAFLSAMSAAARSGVLFKGGRYLERMAEVDTVAFDKTGTLTSGQLRVSDVIPCPGYRAEDVLRIAAALEARSDHPIGQAIVAHARRSGVAWASSVDGVQAAPGRGIRGMLDGREVFAGSAEYARERWGLLPAAVGLAAEALQREGRTVVFVGDAAPIGLIGLEDAPRPEAAALLRRLRQLGVRRIAMLTGDHRRVAERVARQLGLDEVYAELLPEDKVKLVERLAREGTVAMVGDGINDAPALARAHVGIAMGAAGSDAALETADVVLMSDRLDRLAYALELGRRTRRVVMQGLGLAVAVIAVLSGLALLGAIPLSAGVVGHEGSTLLVALNGLRLLWQSAGAGPGPERAAGGRGPAPAAAGGGAAPVDAR